MSQTFSVKYNASVIILSIGIAFIGAYGGIVLSEQFRLCSKENQPKLLNRRSIMWLMAISLGGVAVWTMHFVGMSAITLYDPNGAVVKISYRLDLTLVSLVVVILLCYVGIYLSSRDGVYTHDNEDTVDEFIRDAARMTIQELRAMRHKNYFLFRTLFKKMHGIVAGGTTTAVGVCVMHYIGMEAMMIEHGKMTWNVGIVAASVIIAVVAATAAFWILFRLLSLYPQYEILRIASAAVASIAVNGMHYTGMAAMQLRYDSEAGMPHSNGGVISIDQSTACIGAIVASITFLWFIIMLVIADLRAWFYSSSQIVRRTDQLMKKLEHDLEALHASATAYVGAAAAAQNSAVGILSKLPERYKHIRDHDHYQSSRGDRSSGNKSGHAENRSVSGASRRPSISLARGLFVSGGSAENIANFGTLFIHNRSRSQSHKNNSKHSDSLGHVDRFLPKSLVAESTAMARHPTFQDLETGTDNGTGADTGCGPVPCAGTGADTSFCPVPCAGTCADTGCGPVPCAGTGADTGCGPVPCAGTGAVVIMQSAVATSIKKKPAAILAQIGEQGEDTVPSSLDHGCDGGRDNYSYSYHNNNRRRPSTIFDNWKASLATAMALPLSAPYPSTYPSTSTSNSRVFSQG